MKMHVGLLAVIAVIVGLQAVGIIVPTAVLYLVVLACPLMMITMMRGHDHGGHSVADSSVAVERDQRSLSDTIEPGPGAKQS